MEHVIAMDWWGRWWRLDAPIGEFVQAQFALRVNDNPHWHPALWLVLRAEVGKWQAEVVLPESVEGELRIILDEFMREIVNA